MGKLKEKILKFIKSDSKINIVYMKALQIIQFCYYGCRLGDFGKGSCILSPRYLHGKRNIFIGRNVSILWNARIEAISSYGDQSFTPKLIIGDRTSIGQNFHCIAGGNLSIGRDVLMSANIYIADILHEWKEIDVNVARQPLAYRQTRIGDFCFIGYGAVILPGAILGRQCIVGSNAVVVPGQYPDYSVLVGVPAKIFQRYDSEAGSWKRVSDTKSVDSMYGDNSVGE